MRLVKIIALLLVAGSLLACTISANVPKIQTGVTESLNIDESAATNNTAAAVNIEMGAGSLNIAPGASTTVQGTVEYNVHSWVPQVSNSGGQIKISQSNTSSVGVPDGQIVNTWELKLGQEPMELSIATGANDGTFDLSGLALTRLIVSDGASRTKVVFDQANPGTMSLLQYHTGASEVSLFGLANANAQEIEFSGGAGSYKLDFSGTLTQDMEVRVSTGMSDLTLTIPEGVHAVVTINGGLSNINANGTWNISSNRYECGSSGPTINITVDMAVGNLNLNQN